jgi:hypothetical protein
MKLVHESKYPGLNANQFRDLIADREYQQALATHGKVALEDVVIKRTANGASTSWVSSLHRSLTQPVLRPLKAIFPQGFTAKWRETHVYKGNHGTMHLEVEQPKSLKVALDGDESLSMQGANLVRKIEVDMGRSKMPLAMRLIPRIRHTVAGEVDRGLTRADECTAKWLKDHPNRYKLPEPHEVIDVSMSETK